MGFTRTDSPKLTAGRRNPARRYAIFQIAVSLAYSAVFTSIEFAGSPVSGLRGAATLFIQWLVVAFCTLGVTGLLSLSRHVFAVLFPLLTGASAALAYFKLSMGASLTPMVIELAVVNDAATSAELVSPLLVAVTVLGICAGAAAAVWRMRLRLKASTAALFALADCVIVAVPTVFVERFRAPVTSRMPYSFYEATAGYLRNRRAVALERHTFDNVAISHADGSSPDIVVVIGESLRADHLSINGYGRKTTPYLDSDTGAVSFPHMFTEPHFTHLCVPRIVTRADSLNPDLGYEEQSFISLLRRAGYRSAWLSNQDDIGTYTYFVHEADTLAYANAGHTLYDFGKWLDTDLLPPFDSFMGPKAESPRLAVIHSIGSHWWYGSHYPDSLAVFTPEADSRVISDLSHEQIVNSYDNTVLATDDFLRRLTERLRGRNAVLIYVSDHGEALGENGRYLHADDCPELHNPACVVWVSEAFAEAYPEKAARLRANSRRRFLTDAIFHTVVSASGCSTPVLDRRQSLFDAEL